MSYYGPPASRPQRATTGYGYPAYPPAEGTWPTADPWGGAPPPTNEWPGPGGYWPPPEPPRRHPLRWVIVALLLVVFVVFAGTAVTVALSRLASGANTGTTPGNGPGGAPTSGPTSVPTGSSLNEQAIIDAVDPTVVNINTTLGLQQAKAAGTGIVLTSSGDVLTNNHVIAGATSISGTDVGNGQTYEASVVGYDRTHDLAVIHLQGASKLHTAPIGDATKVSVGDSIMAIGNAGGVGGTPTAVTGTVTALNQTITASDDNGANAEQLTGLLRVAANIQPGDSGGPLVDDTGHVIGVDTAATAGFRFQETGGEGFAIPINQAVATAKQIEAGRASDTVHIGKTAFLGVSVSAQAGQDANGGTVSGAAVAGVVSGSPADQAGLSRGDVITSVDGTTVDTPTTLTDLLARHHPGDQVSITWIDQTGQSRTAKVALVDGPTG